MAERTCEQCGKAFKRKRGRNAGRFCSRECSFAWKAEHRKRREVFVVFRCKQCRMEFVGISQRAMCSRECELASERERSKATYVPELPRTIACRECGTSVRCHGRGSRRSYCKPCASRRLAAAEREAHKEQNKRRRARLRGATTERFSTGSIFLRDGYYCGICGVRTDPSKTVPHPLSPTLDHIMPIAMGGGHTKANTQCACFQCNWMKRDSVNYVRWKLLA
jgi:hypothetical protein